MSEIPGLPRGRWGEEEEARAAQPANPPSRITSPSRPAKIDTYRGRYGCHLTGLQSNRAGTRHNTQYELATSGGSWYSAGILIAMIGPSSFRAAGGIRSGYDARDDENVSLNRGLDAGECGEPTRAPPRKPQRLGQALTIRFARIAWDATLKAQKGMNNYAVRSTTSQSQAWTPWPETESPLLRCTTGPARSQRTRGE